MKKLAISLFLIVTTLLFTACDNKSKNYDEINENQSSVIIDEDNITINEKMKKQINTVEMPITIVSNDTSLTKYVQINKNGSLEENMKIIINTISKEGFNSLPINVKVYGKNIARIELIEHETSKNSRVTWEDDYLNESTKEYTINTIIKNVIQEDYKGEWIEKVQLYYNDELIQID